MIRFFNNNLNPLLIRELRQFVRNQFITILISFYVVALVAACLIVLSSAMATGSMTNGQKLFITLGYIMYITSFFVIVVRTSWNTASDKISEDLMFFSSMTPLTIVCGKMLSSIIVTLLLMSVTMPFVTMAYLWRGLEPQTIVIVFAIIFILLQILNAYAILVALSGKTKNANIQTLFSTFILFFFSNGFLADMIHILIMKGSSSFLLNPIFYISIVLSIGFIALLMCGATVVISPPNSNRSFPMRISLTSIFLITVGLIVVLSKFFSTLPLTYYTYVAAITLIALITLTIFMVCERDQWSTRIRRNLPKSFFLRMIVFPFYSGAACGIVWILMMVFFIGIFEMLLIPNTTDLRFFQIKYEDNEIHIPLLLALVIFTFNYGVTAMLIRSWFFKKLDSAHVKTILICLLLIFSLGSFLIYLLTETGS
ncbi:MAG: hypothetical protein LBC74_13590, partial [Planctomycetaceae bacterium]|nr:hypothetical protein [Planctomycetaceae bacterium]